jgi:hypothetical protein
MIRKIFYHAKKIPGVGTVWQEVVKLQKALKHTAKVKRA